MTTENQTRSSGANGHLVTASVAIGALIVGVLFRLVVGNAAIVLAPLIAVAAVIWAWRHKTATKAAPAEEGGTE